LALAGTVSRESFMTESSTVLNFAPLAWVGDVDGYLSLLDQTLLPVETRQLAIRDVPTLFEAIRALRVRGAPAIGIAAAYGICLGLQQAVDLPESEFYFKLDETAAYLASSRPTAVNLFWALQRMRTVAANLRGGATTAEIRAQLLVEARALHEEDDAMCRAIGRHGAALFKDGDGVLTHCNAGGLATSGYGTALATLYSAQEQGKRLRVFVDETRPLLQGARLTAWELQQAGFDVTLICDNMAAQVMREGRVQAVIVGADRIAANGDAANKIGTYGVAVLAAAHDVPFYVAAPSSTFDLSLPDGTGIPIEERDPREVSHGFGRQTAPEGVRIYNPAFDVTPARLIRGIVCERGVVSPVTTEGVAKLLGTSTI
jgi:methylthioribose-1-phosphate isomerase